MNHALHAHTPYIRVADGRGLTLNEVAYRRTLNQEQPAPLPTTMRWNAAAQLTAQQDPRLPHANLSTRYGLSGQVLLTDSVDAGWHLTLLGEAGQLVEQWDGRGSHRQTEYDELLRPVAIRESVGARLARESISPTSNPLTVERFTYGGPDAAEHNQCSQLIRHDDPTGTVRWPYYNLLGSPVSKIRRFLIEPDMPHWPLPEPGRDELLEPAEYASIWSFNALGETLQQTDAMGNSQRFAQTVAGQLKTVELTLAGSGQAETLVSEIHYNAFDQVEQEAAGNGVVSRSTYDPQSGRLIELNAGLANAEPLQQLKYDYDPVGNILQIEDAAQPVQFFANQRIEPINHYRYDTLYQLIEATGREVKTGSSHGPALPDLQNIPPDPNQIANYMQSYDYDAGGNLLQMRHVGAQSFTRTMLVAPDSNRSLPEGEVEVDFEKGFDANGNLQQLVRGQDLRWDVRNQLREVTTVKRDDGPDDSECYIYDGGGQRCRKIRSAQSRNRTLIEEVRYLPGLEIRTGADGEILHAISVSAGRNSVRVLHWQAKTPPGIANDQLRYNLNDHLGSSTLELDHQGGLISQENYYPFGGTAWWAASNEVEAKYKTIRYSGKERDATGLYYYGFRYYAPWLQRWINPDPAGAGLNVYLFVENNPSSMTDIAGLVPTLLYGFESVRERLIENLGQQSGRSFVAMDKLNAGLGITPQFLLEDYEVIITDLREGYDVDEEGIEAFMQISAPHYKGPPEEAATLLQSWSSYLTEHQDMFDIQKKLQRYHGPEGKTKAMEFWRKNLDSHVPAHQIEQFTTQLQRDPEAFFAQSSGHAKIAMGGITNWVFRRFSKMGLDWMINTQPAHDQTNVWFLNIALKDPNAELPTMQELTSEMYTSRPYAIQEQSNNTFGPITHSERRHLERNMATPDSRYSTRTKFISLAQAKNFRTSQVDG